MYQLYSILLGIWIAFMMPVFLYRALRYGKYLQGLRQRFGRLSDSLRSDGRPTFWFHSCSVGETLSIQPLAKELHLRFPEARFVFSTITKTGQTMARQRFSAYGSGNTFYFPVDLASVCRYFLDWIQPTVIVIIDTEIWPNLLRQAHLRGIPIIMANGRISPKSFRFYRFIGPMLRRVFANYRVLLMKSEDDAGRIRMIGAPPGKVIVTGNIKYDKELVEQELSKEVAQSLDEALGLTSGVGDLIVAGSTHADEERILIEVLRRVRLVPGLGKTRLLLTPRHPERFDAVADLAARAGFLVRRRSEDNKMAAGADVMVLDTLGELATAYQFATIAFVGGTLIPHGGQSILEPAWYAKPIVIGPSMENFREVAGDFRARGAVKQIQAVESDKEAQINELTDAFVWLLEDEERRTVMGNAAYSVFENNRGAARFTVDQIAAIYKDACKGATIQ
ncbi:MAG: 3-deoxy-D-manno-octulosonic acid transferase [Syntrophobacteraceae bacterium]